MDLTTAKDKIVLFDVLNPSADYQSLQDGLFAISRYKTETDPVPFEIDIFGTEEQVQGLLNIINNHVKEMGTSVAKLNFIEVAPKGSPTTIVDPQHKVRIFEDDSMNILGNQGMKCMILKAR